MGKFKQHYMIKLGEGEIHPLFRLDYLPENLASFVETLVLFLESSLILLFCANLAINIMNSNVLDSATLYMINRFSTGLFALVRIPNVRPYDILAITIMIVVYLLSRRYFEFVKYNLHMIRNSVCPVSDKAPKKQK